jgi:hypothetical protein
VNEVISLGNETSGCCFGSSFSVFFSASPEASTPGGALKSEGGTTNGRYEGISAFG